MNTAIEPRLACKIVIPRWHPVRLNKLLTSNRHAAGRLKQIDATLILVYALHLPRARGPRKVDLQLTYINKRSWGDPDAFWKSALDGLVKCKMLIDDHRKYCTPGSVDYVVGPERGTVITLWDLTPEE